MPPSESDTTHLRHTLAALAYRAAKALRDAPDYYLADVAVGRVGVVQASPRREF